MRFSAGTIRFLILHGIFVIVAALLIVQLFRLQVVFGDDYRERAERQYINSRNASFDRGSIFFTDKEGRLISAATVKRGFLLAINPSKLSDEGQAYEFLNSIVPVDRELFFKKAAKKNDPYEELVHYLDEETAERISSRALSGVIVERERWRAYPGGTLAAHVLGFVGFVGNDRQGVYGLERYYEDVLRRGEKILYKNVFAEIFLDLKQSLVDETDVREGNIVTTIEPSVQKALEQKLDEVQKTYNAAAVAGIIIDPVSGAIVALANIPSFDPNTFSEERDSAVFSNRFVEGVYEMGSIVKPLTLAAGIDAGAITPALTYDDKGSASFNGATIRNFDGRARGIVPMQEILNQSLNTGAVFVMQTMGKEIFAGYMRSFGIAEETGIDLPNETAGLAENLESIRDIEFATASFGQGIAFTPIGITRALATLANGGVFITPHVVEKIEYEDGGTWEFTPTPERRVLKKSSSEEITRMLVTVVDTALVGGTLKLPRYSIAAKTGTAQMARRDGKGYYEDKYLHSFFGYFPAFDPEFLVFMYMTEPQGVRYASESLAKPFMDMAKFLLRYYNISPDR